jgi:hypothetical protein
MADGGTGDEQNARARRRRNIVLGLVLGGLVVLFFVMTMVRMGQVGP